jgi:hypothetical protein
LIFFLGGHLHSWFLHCIHSVCLEVWQIPIDDCSEISSHQISSLRFSELLDSGYTWDWIPTKFDNLYNTWTSVVIISISSWERKYTQGKRLRIRKKSCENLDPKQSCKDSEIRNNFVRTWNWKTILQEFRNQKTILQESGIGKQSSSFGICSWCLASDKWLSRERKAQHASTDLQFRMPLKVTIH